ncbi:MAG: hypothetical protein LBG48_00360 [Rickettsiales bacterium]|jgi:hypothetical protein|nr:hypothetical protein [Rickettsiales bacterium]
MLNSFNQMEIALKQCTEAEVIKQNKQKTLATERSNETYQDKQFSLA